MVSNCLLGNQLLTRQGKSNLSVVELSATMIRARGDLLVDRLVVTEREVEHVV